MSFRIFVPLSLLLCASVLPVRAQTGTLKPADATTLRERMVAEALKNTPASNSTLDQWLLTLRPNGTWPDIDLTSHAQGVWRPSEHLVRVLSMAVALKTPGTPSFGDARLKAATLAAYSGWFSALPEGTPTSTNWWHNEIGVQLKLGPIMLLLQDDLSPEQKQAGLTILTRAWTPNDTSYKNQAANMTWRARITLWRALLANDEPLFRVASGHLQSVTAITEEEGTQVDGSFHQHGPQLYSLGYGNEFASGSAQMARLLAGTSYAYPPRTIEDLSHMILDGQAWMMRGSVMDHSARGREIAREQGKPTSILPEACDNLIAIGAPRARELTAFKTRMQSVDAPELIGNRAFFRSGLMSHRRQGFYISARATPSWLRSTEKGNGENLRATYMGYGTTYIYRTGREYQNIFPVWDWNRIPGETCPQPPSQPIDVDFIDWGAGTFAGGASNGQTGAWAYDYSRQGTSACKGWFFFDREMVCLDAGITSASEFPIATSINQEWSAGDVSVSARGGVQTFGGGQASLDGARWVHHNGVGYFFPGPTQNVVLKNAVQTGQWTDIKSDAPDKAPISKAVFSVWLDHGVRPQNASASYVIVPGLSVAQMDAYPLGDVQIASNTRDCQAVYLRNQRSGEAIFYTPGSVILRPGLTITVSQPCVVVARETAGHVELAVASPRSLPRSGTNEISVPLPSSVQVSVSLPLRGEGATPKGQNCTVNFDLPTGQNTGESVVRTFDVTG